MILNAMLSYFDCNFEGRSNNVILEHNFEKRFWLRDPTSHFYNLELVSLKTNHGTTFLPLEAYVARIGRSGS